MPAGWPRRCSGDMYAKVPIAPAVAVLERSPRWAAPKSERRAAPMSSKRTLEGFTSRWRIPSRWASPSAERTAQAISTARAGATAPRWSRSASVPPGIQASTIAGPSGW